MAAPDPKDIPDLELPSPNSAPKRRGSSPPATAPLSAAAPQSAARPAAGRVDPAAIAISTDDDDFDMALERGGALVGLPTSSSDRKANSGGPASARGSGLAGSGLEITHQRLAPRREAAYAEPSLLEKIAGPVLSGVVFLGTAALLVKFVHRHGGVRITNLLPHAFDASSALQSGGVALGALATAIGIGVAGLTRRPRSYAMIVSGGSLLLAALAMVTVTLVSSEEHPAPPDGALLIPYLVPFAILLLGIGVGGRGPVLFRKGGPQRAASVLAAAIGGGLVFAAIELSSLAARLP